MRRSKTGSRALLLLAPFGLGYFIAYTYRSINALIAPGLISEFGCSPAQIGLLTSVYFLMCASVQLPLGALLDRFGPYRTQAVLMLTAGVGSVGFAMSASIMDLLISRALIGFGVSVSLMAGLKAAVLHVSRDRLGVANSALVAMGGLGAIAATLPAEAVVTALGWRSMFLMMAVLTIACAALLFACAPARHAEPDMPEEPLSFGTIFRDPVFWRVAPLSASCLGSAWAIQGLWAGRWLTEVDGLDSQSVVMTLFAMGLGFCGGTILTGSLVDRLRRQGVGTDVVLGATAATFLALQVLIVTRTALPSLLLWTGFAAFGSIAAMSFLVIGERFPCGSIGRANGALNILHMLSAFVIQGGVGLVVGMWPTNANGLRDPNGYVVALTVPLLLQTVALGWYGWPLLRSFIKGRALALGTGVQPRLSKAAH